MMRYYSFHEYCKETFGEKVYRLSLNGGMSCPNRDGTLSYGGCAFCSEGGSGDFAACASASVSQQIEEAKTRISSKTNCKKFIAYFQAFTNTYGPISYLEQIFSEAISNPEIVALSIGTRSDCLDDDVIELLCRLNKKKPVWIEIGLQTIHDTTLSKMNTHTTFAQFDDALTRLTKAGIPVIAHLILGLPGETKEMMLESVSYVAHSSVKGIKLQLLHVLRGTDLATLYENDPFPTFDLEEYCDFIVNCIEMLPSDMVIHRMTGDGPRNLLIAPTWSTDKKRVLNTISHELKEQNTYQGRLYNG